MGERRTRGGRRRLCGREVAGGDHVSGLSAANEGREGGAKVAAPPFGEGENTDVPLPPPPAAASRNTIWKRSERHNRWMSVADGKATSIRSPNVLNNHDNNEQLLQNTLASEFRFGSIHVVEEYVTRTSAESRPFSAFVRAPIQKIYDDLEKKRFKRNVMLSFFEGCPALLRYYASSRQTACDRTTTITEHS